MQKPEHPQSNTNQGQSLSLVKIKNTSQSELRLGPQPPVPTRWDSGIFTPRKCDRSVVRSSTEGHKLGQLYAERSSIAQTVRGVEQCAASTTAPLIRRRWCF
jgi:hypothetical protein